jgi:hypothetical protein
MHFRYVIINLSSFIIFPRIKPIKLIFYGLNCLRIMLFVLMVKYGLSFRRIAWW